MATEFPQTIYETPGRWGSETVYADKPSMLEQINSLIDAGGEEWNEIGIADCREWAFVQGINGHGLYEESRTKEANYLAFDPISGSDGYYEIARLPSMFSDGGRVAQYSSIEDAEKDLS